jgi:hypothetical protein
VRKLLVSAVIVAAVGVVASHPVDAVGFFDAKAVIGSPNEDVSGIADAGAVHLLPTGDRAGSVDASAAITVTRATLGETPKSKDRFGATAAFMPVDRDMFSDLVIGAPGADNGAGRVYLIRFVSPGQFDFAHPTVLRQGHGGLLGTSEAGDDFGSSLAWTFFDANEPWLAIGAPGEDVVDVVDAGAVTLIHNFTDTASDTVFYQGSGLPGTAERGDRFGATLVGTVGRFTVGAPGEDVRSVVDAGDITSFYPDIPGSGTELQEGKYNVPGTPETRDRFGAALGDRNGRVAIGIPGEDIGDIRDAGAVVDILPPPPPDRCCDHRMATLWYQGHNGLAGVPEAGDRFGAALAQTVDGALVVGVPGEDVGGVVDAGLIAIVRQNGTYGNLEAGGNRQFWEDKTGVPGIGEVGDQMGASLGSVGSTVLVGLPWKDVTGVADAGSVLVLGLDEELEPNPDVPWQVITQDDLAGSSAEAGDRFGTTLEGKLT